MGYYRTAGPGAEPVTLDEAKAQLYLDSTFQDARVTSLIAAARAYFEQQTNRRLISQAWRLSLERYPLGVITTPIGPVTSVDALKYTDTDMTVVTVDTSAYLVDTSGPRARLTPALFQPWPWTYWAAIWSQCGRELPDAVTVDFTTGYGTEASSVPEDIRQAILLMVAHWYSNREPVITGVRAAAVDVPHSVTSIIDAYRLPGLG